MIRTTAVIAVVLVAATFAVLAGRESAAHGGGDGMMGRGCMMEGGGMMGGMMGADRPNEQWRGNDRAR